MKNYIKEAKYMLVILMPLCIIFYFVILKNYNDEKPMIYEYEVSCYMTEDNSYISLRGALCVCDTIWIPNWLQAIHLPDNYIDRMKDKVKEDELQEIASVPFPYELSKKRGSDTIVVVTEKQDTLLFYLPKYKESATIFSDPKQYFKDVFKIKEE